MFNLHFLKRNILCYYFSVFFITLAQALPHSILTVLLLSKGVSIADIAMIQAMFSLAILLFEIPSGVWADLYSKKTLYILSNGFLILSFIIIFYYDEFYLLCLAWFVYGFSAALSSGTLDTQVINDIKHLKEKSSEGFINKFLKYSSQINIASLLIGSLLGSYLYFKIGLGIYILGSAFVICSLICISFFKEEKKGAFKEKKLIKKHLYESVLELKENKALRFLFVFSIISQIFFQSHYQLWQAFFLEKGFNEKYLYILYVIFQISSITALWLSKEENARLHFFVKFIFLLLFILPVLLMQNLYFVSLAYIAFTFLFVMFDYRISCLFANSVSKERISSLGSAKSSFSRLSAFFVLLLCSVALKYYSVSYVVFVNFLLAMLFMLFLSFIAKRIFI